MGDAERPAHGRSAPRLTVRTSRITMRIPRTKKLLSCALGLIVLGFVWFYFAPVGLGGSTSYVVTDGVSMEPRFHTGDLAIVRSQSSYKVGEIVAYQNKMLHTIVLHRIIGRTGTRYIFKGDNNHFVDFEHPAASQLIGALWIHIPGAGADLKSLRSPLLTGALVTVGILLFIGAAFTQRRRLRGRQRRAGLGAQGVPGRPPRRSATPAAGLFALGLLALLPFLLLALLAFTRPTAAAGPFKAPYKQSGTLSYSANSTPGPTYPGDRAVTGDPLFTHLVNVVDLRFGYLFHAADPHTLRGTASLSATVASSSGWQTTLQLGAPTRFRGDHATATGHLDLASLLALLLRVETMTAVKGSATLTIVPHVHATGHLAAMPLQTTFSPQIKFLLSPLELQPAGANGDLPAEGQSSLGQLAPSAYGLAQGNRSQPLSLSFGVAQLSVASARRVALYGIALVVLALLALLACLRLMLVRGRSRPRDESARIHARYGRMIVPVARVWPLPGVPVIDVADMEALGQIAEHYDRSILHETAPEGEAYWVADESGHFRYALGAWAGAAGHERVEELSDETLVNDVYADEIEFGEAGAAHGAPPAEEPFPAEPVIQGDWTPRRDSGRGHAGKPRLV
jgi:signal peptidase I